MPLEIYGPVYEFGFCDPEDTRKYVVATLPFRSANKYFKPRRYEALTGEGEQREIHQRHAVTLKKAMIENKFTPAAASVALTESQQAKVVYEDREDEAFEGRPFRYARIKIEDGDTVPLIDAGHRMMALEMILAAGDERANIQPITVMILLNSNAKLDFINLQLGRVVDRSHMLSLTVQEEVSTSKVQNDILKLAMDIAKQASTDKESPFYRQIKFDTRGSAPLPISSIMSKGSSDSSTSLVGGAKIAISFGADADWMACNLTNTFLLLQEKAPNLLKPGMVLCPPPDGKKGGATMIVGIANIMAYRLLTLKHKIPDDSDISKLIEAVNKALNRTVAGNFAAAKKRELMGNFTQWFLADLDEPEHEGIPINLIKILSTSTFDVSRLPKEPKPKKITKKKPAKKKAEPAIASDNIDVDEEEPLFTEEAPKTKFSNKADVVEEEVFAPDEGSEEAVLDSDEMPW